MSPGNGSSSHPFVVIPITGLHDIDLTFTNVLFLLHHGDCSGIYLASFLNASALSLSFVCAEH